MSVQNRSRLDPHKRHATGTPGIVYRMRAGGRRTYYVQSGNTFTKVAGGGLKEARALKAELDGRRGRGERVVLPKRVTFEHAAEAWLEDAHKRLRPTTVDEYETDLRAHILPRLKGRLLASISPRELRDLIEELRATKGTNTKRPLSESRVANICKPCSATLAFAVEEGWLSVSPWSLIGRGKKPVSGGTREHRSWSAADVQAVISASHTLATRKGARRDYSAIVETMLLSGLRLGETLGLQWQDVDFTEGTLNVRRQFTRHGSVSLPKTHAGVRAVPVPPVLIATLRKHLAAQMALGLAGQSAFVFAGSSGVPPSHTNFRRRGWDLAITEAKLDGEIKVTPHDARHGYASAVAAQGVSSHIAARVLGHTTAAVTEGIYIGAFGRKEQYESVREALSAAMAGKA